MKKSHGLITNVSRFLQDTEAFEKGKKIIEKHVSSHIMRVPSGQSPAGITGAPAEMITTMAVTVLYVYESKK